MYSVTRLIHTSDPDRLLPELRAFADAANHAVVAPTLPGVRTGGDILMHLRFADGSQWSSVAGNLGGILSEPSVMHVDGVEYRGIPEAADQSAPGTVYRTLLLRVAPDSEVVVYCS